MVRIQILGFDGFLTHIDAFSNVRIANTELIGSQGTCLVRAKDVDTLESLVG